MKKILLLILGFGLFVTSFGQGENKKRPSFGIHFLLNDFRTAANLRSSSLSGILKANEWRKAKYMSSGIAVSYINGLNNNLDFVGTLSGSFLDYPVPGKASRVNPSLLLEGAATANLKLVSDKYFFSPFITAGIGLRSST